MRGVPFVLNSQVGYTLGNFLGFPDVPPLFAQVAAGPPHDSHPVPVPVVALGALPGGIAILIRHNLDLAVEAALVAVVALRVELRIHDVVVDELHHAFDGFDVVAQVRDLHVGDLSAAGDRLELGLKLQLVKGVNMLTHIDMIAVRVVTLIRNIGHVAELLPVDLGKPVAQALGGGAVQGEAQAGLFLPPVTGIPQVLHHTVGELEAVGIRVADPLHGHGALIQADIAQRNGRVTAIEQLVDGFAGLQASNSAVLPHDRGNVGLGAQEVLVTAHQGLEAQFQPLVQERPELPLVPIGQQADLGQVDRNNTLVDALLC